MRSVIWFDAMIADTRFALAHFTRKSGVTITMLVVLAVGMGISTLLFSYVHAYAVQPPVGIARHDDLVRIRGSQTAGRDGRMSRGFSEDEFLAYRTLTGPFAAVAGWQDAWLVLDAGDEAPGGGRDARVTFVTENYFSVLGVRPVMGGLPTREEPGMAAVAVIGHATWDQLFGRRADVIGATLTVSGQPITVVGVAPPGFAGVRMGSSEPQLWMPLATQRMLLPGTSPQFRAVARLHDGVSLSAATAAAQVVAERAVASDATLREIEPSTEVVPLLSANSDPMFERDVRLMSFAVGLLGLLVLLVTCTNVSALLTGLAAARRQEIAIRLSLGAGRSRLIRQLLTESVLLATLAGAAAIGIVWATLSAATRFLPALPFEMGINGTSTTFTFGIALAVGILFGLSPALHATRLGLASVLRDSGGAIAAKRARLQRGLVVGQIAFTQPLIVLLTAVLLIIVRDLRPGTQSEIADRVIMVSFSMRFGPGTTPATVSSAMQQARNTMQRLRDRLQATPGIEATVLNAGTREPLGSFTVHTDDRAATTPEHAVELTGAAAATGYFGVMGIPVVRGRELGSTDLGAEAGTGEVSAVIGDQLARRLWGGADPIGRRLVAATDSVVNVRTLVVVGVVDDPLETNDARQPSRVFLLPDTSEAFPSLLVRTAGAGQLLIPAVRKVLDQETSGLVAEIRTIAEMEDENTRRFRIITGAVSSAGLLALLLSAIGLYAVIAFAVGERAGEIAIRMAVGARAHQIVRRFVADGLRLSLLGLLFGLPISLLGLRLLMTVPDIPSVQLQSVTIIAAFGVILVATAAVWIPARRAALVDPAVILRRE